MEIFVIKVKTLVTKISMLDFVEVLDTPLIILTPSTQSSRSLVTGRGGEGLRYSHCVILTFRYGVNLKLLYESISFPTSTQNPEDVHLWSYFGPDLPDHNMIKIGCIRFFNLLWLFNVWYTLRTRKYRKNFPKNLFHGLNWRPKDVTLRMSLWDIFTTFLRRFSKIERIWKN